MTYQNIIKIAREKVGTQYPVVVEEIERCILAGSTGGEIMMGVGKYLKDLEIMNQSAYRLLKKEIEEYLSDCAKVGLVII